MSFLKKLFGKSTQDEPPKNQEEKELDIDEDSLEPAFILPNSRFKIERKIKLDPIHEDPKYDDIIEKVVAEANEIVGETTPNASIGRCHLVWQEQKRIFKEKYDIDWKTPTELNDDIIFD